jgi:DNA helicase MCM8
VSALVLLQENLKLSPAMLSRFDLIFVLLDRPDELMDQAMSEHIMALHSGKPVACAHYSMQ